MRHVQGGENRLTHHIALSAIPHADRDLAAARESQTSLAVKPTVNPNAEAKEPETRHRPRNRYAPATA